MREGDNEEEGTSHLLSRTVAAVVHEDSPFREAHKEVVVMDFEEMA
ncbi:hypothetical protein ES702_03606 [subsurface metagenome]